MLQEVSVTREQLRTRAEIEFDKARQNFWAFRLTIRSELIKGWWPEEIARHHTDRPRASISMARSSSPCV
jgi:hypothetical protein